MIEFIRNSIEYQGWGLNSLTISSLITILFSLTQGYGLIEQGKQILKQKSTLSLSQPFFVYSAYYFVAFICYGLNKQSLVMIFNGLLVLAHIPIIIGFIRYQKTTSRKNLLINLPALLIPAMIFSDNKEIVLLFSLGGILFFLGAQLMEMLKSKSRGAVNISYLIIFLSTNIFWLIYASAISNWVLQTFNLTAMIIYLIMLKLYHKY